MKIEKTVTLNRHPFKDPKTNKVKNPPPLVIGPLQFEFVDNSSKKVIHANLLGFPYPIMLYGPKTYPKVAEITRERMEKRLLKMLGDDIQESLQKMIPETLESHPNGPGSILSGMLEALGIKSSPTCSCKRRAILMNKNGPDWCEENLEEILGWLQEESVKRKLPFVKTVAKMMVQRAIKKSRRLIAKYQSDA